MVFVVPKFKELRDRWAGLQRKGRGKRFSYNLFSTDGFFNRHYFDEAVCKSIPGSSLAVLKVRHGPGAFMLLAVASQQRPDHVTHVTISQKPWDRATPAFHVTSYNKAARETDELYPCRSDFKISKATLTVSEQCMPRPNLPECASQVTAYHLDAFCRLLETLCPQQNSQQAP